jgi:hypothetical protein
MKKSHVKKKGEKNMSRIGITKGLALSVGLLVGMIGCKTLEQEKQEELKRSLSKPPVIEKSFAAKVIRPGQTWEVYIKASDEDGDMNMFILDFQRTGWPTTPYYLGIKKGDRDRLSGHMRLYTNQVARLDELIYLDSELTVIIEDKQGNYSNAVTFPLDFDYRVTAEEPEPGSFEDVYLGMIPVYELWEDIGGDAFRDP